MEQEWNMLDWLVDAKRLLYWTNAIGEKAPIMLVVRHSHREDSQDVGELLKKRLTDIGHRMASQFGRELPPHQNVEVFYSKHPRCYETAEEIAKGYESKNGVVKLVSDIRVLLGPQGSGERIGHEMLSLGGPEFIGRWSRGLLSPETIEPIERFGDKFISETVERLQSASSDTLQIHVTHDLVIMGARFVLFHTDPTDVNWTPFLGGFGCVGKESQLNAFENGRELILQI